MREAWQGLLASLAIVVIVILGGLLAETLVPCPQEPRHHVEDC